VKAVQEVGIRGVVGYKAMDVPTGPSGWYESTEDTLKGVKQTHHEYHGKLEGRLSIWAIPLQPTFATKELLTALKKFADREGVGLCMHSNYDPSEVDFCLERTGKRPIEYLESIGVLDSNLVLVHVVYVSDTELELLIKYDIKIVHCPATALRLAYGVTKHGRFPEMLREGLTVSLGCDGVNGASNFDLMRAMYLAAGLYKDSRIDATLIPAETALEMGTINGAKTLQMEDKLGSIEKGKMADIIIFDRNRPEWNPLFSVVNTLVYSATGDSVDTVLVNGEIVMEHRKMTSVNEDEVYEQIQQVGENMVRNSGLKLKSRWQTI
jgi:cytosine/adenosine deaminase-related metal-dependent hydrolase